MCCSINSFIKSTIKLSMFLFLSIFFISSYKIHSSDRNRLNSDLFQTILQEGIQNFLNFLNKGVDVNMMIGSSGLRGRSLLSWAAYLGRLDIVELLIMRGADVNLPDPDGSTPLQQATYNNHIEIVRLLLQHKANPNTRNQKYTPLLNDTPLIRAVLNNNFELVKLLLDNKAIIKGHECNYAKSDEINKLLAAEINKLLGSSSCVIL